MRGILGTVTVMVVLQLTGHQAQTDVVKQQIVMRFIGCVVVPISKRQFGMSTNRRYCHKDSVQESTGQHNIKQERRGNHPQQSPIHNS